MQSNLISRSSRLAADPLSDVLALLRTQGHMSGGLDMGGDWALAFGADGAFRCFAVISGQCWLSRADGAPPEGFVEGEFFALPHGPAFSLASDPAVAPRDAYEAIDGPLNGRVLMLGGGGCCLFGALFTFRPDVAGHLLSTLPPVLRVGGDADRAALRGYMDRMMALLREPQPGSVLTTEHLAGTMLIEVLRLHLAREARSGVGWLFALADRQLGRAVEAMPERPARRWTVGELAARAGMSRSAFSVRFKERVGATAMGYLTRWRMLLAADRVVGSSDSVAAIADSLGYASESAFVLAFRREMDARRASMAGERRAARGRRSRCPNGGLPHEAPPPPIGGACRSGPPSGQGHFIRRMQRPSGPGAAVDACLHSP